MADYGAPGSYLTLEEGTPVFSSDGARFGVVAHVLAVPDEDIFDGIVVETDAGHRFADAPQVDEIYEHGVALTLTMDEAARLPEPSENPAAMSVDPDDTVGRSINEKLRRAWDVLSGNY
jgi:hypothetical protein